MFLIGYFLIAIAKVISILINIYIFLIIVDAILFWIPALHNNPMRNFLRIVVEPVLIQIRKKIHIKHVDLAPFIAILIFYFLNEFLVRTLIRLGELFL
ncbi:MAG: YggT family protein [Candidatus Marinimicrobia bacterium]|nr:YggT family protein [Candidatus Neomarinimicrobiota bacterium]